MGNAVAKKPANKISVIHDMLMDREEEIQKVLPETIKAERLIKVALVAMTSNPAIADCSQSSILLALMEAGSVGLEPNGVLGEAALVPYNKKAQFQPMYRGLVKLAKRSGEVVKLEARTVWEGDSVPPGQFSYAYGLDPYIVHTPNPDPDQRGEIAFVYAIAWLRNGLKQFDVMSRSDVEKIRDISRAPKSPAWAKHYAEMAKKTVIKRLCKGLDLSAEFQAVYAKDDSIEAGDPLPLSAIDPSFHGPSIDAMAEERTNQRVEGLRAEIEALETASDESGDYRPDEKSRVESNVLYWETEGLQGGYAVWVSHENEYWPCRVDELGVAFDVDTHALTKGPYETLDDAVAYIEDHG